MTTEGIFDILSKRLCESRAYYAMKREIAADPLVTSVEYVRCRAVVPADNRAAEQSLHQRISPVREDAGTCVAGLFFGQGLIRTVQCMAFRLIRANPNGGATAHQIRNGGKKHGKQENDPHPSEGL